MDTQEKHITREELLIRWERAKQRKREHVAQLEKELREQFKGTALENVKLEVW